MSSLTNEKAHAFLYTCYRASMPNGKVLLPVGGAAFFKAFTPDDECRLLLLGIDIEIRSAAFITAYNPFGELTTPAINRRSHRALTAEVTGTWEHHPAKAFDPLGKWPAEPGLLVLAISLPDALELGLKYNQHAILYVDGKGQANLHACAMESNHPVFIDSQKIIEKQKREFLDGIKAAGKSSPAGIHWHRLWKRLKRFAINDADAKSLRRPLILGGDIASDAVKHVRLSEQLDWANQHGCFSLAIKIMENIPDSGWNINDPKHWDDEHPWVTGDW